ncbi:MAG: hypothetical protein IKJ24_03520 [Clostridia bacterium]|nr:hypothetical protein [Clostridia bacterium]
MNESRNSQNQNSKTSKAQNNAQNNAQKKATGEQTPSPAVPNRAHTQMSSAKNAKNSK